MGKTKPQPAKGDDGIPHSFIWTWNLYSFCYQLIWLPLCNVYFWRDVAANLILAYLHKQNRPYSITDITNNLHNAITKSSAQKILQQLVDAGGVSCKTQGTPFPHSFRMRMFILREAKYLCHSSGRTRKSTWMTVGWHGNANTGRTGRDGYYYWVPQSWDCCCKGRHQRSQFW